MKYIIASIFVVAVTWGIIAAVKSTKVEKADPTLDDYSDYCYVACIQ